LRSCSKSHTSFLTSIGDRFLPARRCVCADAVCRYKPNANKQVAVDWAELQVKTTANFCSRSLFWNFVSGGLSNQIEHHLFPSTCHVHYTAIAPIVQKTCEEFGIK
jgi:fatty acid desaturase